MKKTFILALVLLLIIPAIQAQTGCCAYPAADADKFCTALQVEQTECCLPGETYCLPFFFSGQDCNAISQCDLGCCVCRATDNTLNQEYLEEVLCSGGGLVNGYCIQLGYVDALFNSTIGLTDCDTYVPPSSYFGYGLITGIVRESDGTPIYLATVSGGGAEDTTDSTGNFALANAIVGTYHISAEATGYEIGSTEVTVTKDDETSNTIIILTAISIAPVTVSVVNTVGDVIMGAQIEISSFHHFSTTPSYTFSHVSIGVIEVKVSHPDYETSITTHTLTSAGLNIPIILQPKEYKDIEGTITDTSGFEIQNAQIRVFQDGLEIDSTTSDADGDYTLTHVPTGPTSVIVSALNYNSNTTYFNLQVDKTLDITLTSAAGVVPGVTCTLQIRVVPDISPTSVIEYALVSLQGGISDRTDINGQVQFVGFPCVNYEIRVSKVGYHDATRSVSPLTPTSPIEIIELTEIPSHIVTGHVYDLDGNEISGAYVRVSDYNQAGPTSSNGAYSIELHEGTHLLRALADGYLSDNRLETISATNNNGIDFYLPPEICSVNLSKPSLDYVTQTGAIILMGWENECLAESYKIIKNGADYDVTPGDEFAYYDFAITPAQTVCYIIQARYGSTIKDSNQMCIDIGPSACFDYEGEYCENNTRMECNQGIGSEIEVCSLNYECIQSGSENTVCVEMSNCFMCSRPFGIFPYDGTTFIFGFPTPCTNAEYCFLDSKASSVDTYDECDQIANCYDYVSEGACTQNTCQKNQDCEWVESTFAETGFGVCRPVDNESQDCNEFSNSRASTYHSEVFGARNRATCQLYGNCYFDAVLDSCLNKEETSCWNFRSESDCTNGTSVKIDAGWKTIAPKEKISGTNTILNRSKDYFDLGLCEWNQPSFMCYKNADNGSTPVPPDCDLLNERCKLDNEAPETIVDIPAVANTLNIGFFTRDNVYTPIEISTHYCIILADDDITNDCYPNILAENNVMSQIENAGFKISPGNTFDFENGIYNLYYFSEDPSHNLEQIRVSPVLIDIIPPGITYDIKKEIYVQEEGHGYETLLMIELILASNDETAFCTSFLTRSGASEAVDEPSDMDGSERVEWHESFSNVPDGDYIYRFDCNDLAGNLNSTTIDLHIDADETITNPTRITVANHNNVAITIETESNAKCKYSTDSTTAFTFSIPFTTTGAKTHSSIVDIPGIMQVQRYYVICNMTNTGQIIRGSTYGDVDTIIVTVDDEAPITRVETIAGEPLDTVPLWVNGFNFQLVCNDTEMNGGNVPREFGCEDIFYCQGSIGCFLLPVGEDHEPQITGTTDIVYYSVDKGGNEEFEHTAHIKFDNIVPVVDVTQEDFTTKEEIIIIDGTIDNFGPISGPFDSETTSKIKRAYYEITYDGAVHETTEIAPLIENGTPAKLIFLTSDAPIILAQNKINSIKVIAEDEASNEGFDILEVVQDSLGPSIGSFEIKDKSVYSLSSPYVQAGYDSDITIYEVEDQHPVDIIDKLALVDSVWVEDPFGVETLLTSTSVEWIGTLATRVWPVGIHNLTIHANDTFGNINSVQKTVILRDDIEPSISQFKIEDKYGNQRSIIGAGRYYAIMDATEPLENISEVYYTVESTGDVYDLTLLAVTFDHKTWIAYFDVPAEISGSDAELSISMYDRNGKFGESSTTFFISSNSLELPEPIANLFNDTYYINNNYISFTGIVTGLEYFYKLNGKTTQLSAAKIIGLLPGLNTLEIKAESSFDNKILNTNDVTYEIFYDPSTPEIANVYPIGTVSSAERVGVTIEDSTKSGLDIGASIIAVISHDEHPTAANDYELDILFTASLSDGDYTATADVQDRAGNFRTLTWEFRVNPVAPTITFNVLGSTKYQNKYITNNNQPTLTAVFSEDVSNPIIEGAGCTLTGSGTAYECISSLAEGFNEIKISVGDDFWIFYVVVDTQAPQLDIETKEVVKIGPVDVYVNVLGEWGAPLSGTLDVDGFTDTSAEKISNELYKFIWNVANTASETDHNLLVTLTDIVGNSGNNTRTILVDKTQPSLNESSIEIHPLTDLLKLNGAYITKNHIISILGNSLDENMIRVYAIGSDDKEYESTGIGDFNIQLPLLGTSLSERTNNIRLVFEDRAGNRREFTVTITKDLRPPELIQLSVEK